MEKVSVTSNVRPFTDNGDMMAWLKKLRLLARLRKVADVAKLLPMCLKGDVFSLDLEIKKSNQLYLEQIEAELRGVPRCVHNL